MRRSYQNTRKSRSVDAITWNIIIFNPNHNPLPQKKGYGNTNNRTRAFFAYNIMLRGRFTRAVKFKSSTPPPPPLSLRGSGGGGGGSGDGSDGSAAVVLLLLLYITWYEPPSHNTHPNSTLPPQSHENHQSSIIYRPHDFLFLLFLLFLPVHYWLDDLPFLGCQVRQVRHLGSHSQYPTPAHGTKKRHHPAQRRCYVRRPVRR